MIVLWSIVFVVGLVVASLASQRAVAHAISVADATNLSSGFIGMSVMAIGTDLPEIANSIISATTGHGDLNVGDSAGSALTQVTLVLGILCWWTTMVSDQRNVAVLGVLTAAALGVVAVLVRDELFGRRDAGLLIVAWFVSLLVMWWLAGGSPPSTEPNRAVGHHVAFTALWLGAIAIAATVVVQSFVALTDALGIPEILAGAVVLALGTSLPELFVDWTAVRRGAGALALGDLFGSSLLDATLAIATGPAIAPTRVSSAAAATCVVAAVGVLAATFLAASRRTIGRPAAVGLVATYGVATVALVSVSG